MKVFALLPLVALLFAVAVSGDEDEPGTYEISVPSENEPPSTASSVSYGGFGSPHDNESDEQPGKNVTIHYGGHNHTSYSTGRHHQRGRRVHNVHGSRHSLSRHQSRGNSSRVSRHGNRHGGRQGLSSGRLSGGLGNIAKNIPSLPAGVPNLQNIAKNIPGIPSSPVDLGDLQGQDENAVLV